MVSVFHCDDSAPFRLLVREMLRELGGVELVGEAASLDDAVVALPPAAPDVVLVDLLAPGREAAMLAALRGAAPRARLVLYTGMPAENAPAGADGHIHKSAPFEELHRAILAAASP